MKKMYDKLVNYYGFNEPMFTDEMSRLFEMSPVAFRQNIKRLSDQGLLVKVEKGIYFIPKPNSILKTPKLSPDRIIEKKYLKKNGEIIGYKTGVNFSNSLGLTKQTASIPTIISNNTSSKGSEILIYNKQVKIKKPKIEVTTSNYKWLQVLDLLSEFDRYSEYSLLNVTDRLKQYLNDVQLSVTDAVECLGAYSKSTLDKVIETRLLDEITRGSRSI